MNKPPEVIIKDFENLIETIKIILKSENKEDYIESALLRTLSLGPWVLDAYNTMKRAKEKTYRAYMYHLQHCKDKHVGVEVPDVE